MIIDLRSRNVVVTDQMRSAVEAKVSKLSRYLGGMESARVQLREEKHRGSPAIDTCEVTLAGHGRVVRAHATAGDAMTAVDLVIDKLEHRMEKVKGRLVGRSHPRRG